MASDRYPPAPMTTEQTPEEEANINTCKEYISICYSPSRNTGANSVSHLCHPDSWFWSPSAFPGCQTPLEYADIYSRVVASVKDLHIIRFDQVLANNGHVLLLYTTEGTDPGEPHMDVEPNGTHHKWCAIAMFEVEGGKIKSFTKSFDQKVKQTQLSLAPVTESDNPRWNLKALQNPEESQKKKE